MKNYIRIIVCVFLFIINHFNLIPQTLNSSDNIKRLKWINFSPYTQPGQNPSLLTKIENEQIISLLDSLKPWVEGIRTFQTKNGLENIPNLAKQRGFKVIVGIGLGKDIASNAEQIASGISIAKAGYADKIIVGSEVLLRNELTANQIVEYINQVKKACPDIPVSYAEIASILLDHPEIIDACDFVAPNIYPFWDSYPIECALQRFHQMYQSLSQKAGGKKIFISESGWKTIGPPVGDAVPSLKNAINYNRQLLIWSKAYGIEVNLFSAFDEPWKLPDDDGWGIFYRTATMKEGMDTLFTQIDSIDSTWLHYDIRSSIDTLNIDYIPPMESYEYIKGHTNNIEPSKYKIACYIKVGGEWWVKPYADNPTVPIQCNGNWRLDYTTGGIDQLATDICIYLVPTDYSPNLSDINQKSIARKCITRCPLPYSQITASKETIYYGDALTLTAENGTTYLWSTGDKTREIQVSPATTTNYFVMLTTAAGCVETSFKIITVLKADQTIIFRALQNVTTDNKSFNLTAHSSSGLEITFTSSNTNVATISGSTVTIVGPGTTEITASQEGNANYNAAISVVQTLTVIIDDIHEVSVNAIKLFPNPNNGNFIMKLEKELSEETTIRIFNTLGHISKFLIVNKPENRNIQELKIENIPKGIYFVILQSRDLNIVKKVVVQ